MLVDSQTETYRQKHSSQCDKTLLPYCGKVNTAVVFIIRQDPAG